ncbi:ABC transporter ATP-binding protein [SAR202 cluster bacterium AD-802-E10_MRT_200m]|nr:ABC transporter ATP-binding protein [SAR202 cluster bacterium AD-802-E10_MRT_200m]
MNIYAERLNLVMNGIKILDEVSFSIPDGSFSCIIGPNGAGKSSLLRVISKDLSGYSGSISNLKPDQMTYLPQDLVAPPFLSTIEVVKLGFFRRSLTNNEQEIESLKLLESYGIKHLAFHSFADISAGEKQRAWLAFALAQSKKIIFMDEPLAAIDYTARKNFFTLLSTIVHSGKTLVLVTHDIGLAIEMCDHLIVLESGKKVFEGTPTDFQTSSE